MTPLARFMGGVIGILLAILISLVFDNGYLYFMIVIPCYGVGILLVYIIGRYSYERRHK